MNAFGRARASLKKQGQEAIITGTERWWSSNIAKIFLGMSALAALSRVFGVFLSFIVETAINRYRQSRSALEWKERSFTNIVQGALYSPDAENRRVEKRTLFELSLDQVLHNNDTAVSRVKTAAEATTKECPVLTAFLPAEDKWHVLNAALNTVSSVHAAFHLQADIEPEGWRHEWYVVAMLCEKRDSMGRRFAGGSKRGDALDGEETFTATTKVQVICVKEETIQKMIQGEVVQPKRWQNERHRNRFSAISTIAALYKQQHEDPNGPGSKHLLRLSIPAPLSFPSAGSQGHEFDYTGSNPVRAAGLSDMGPRRSSVPLFQNLHESTPGVIKGSPRSPHPLAKARNHPERGRSWHDPLSLGGQGWDPTNGEMERVRHRQGSSSWYEPVGARESMDERGSSDGGSLRDSRENSRDNLAGLEEGGSKELTAEDFPLKLRPLPPMIPESPALDGSVIPLSPQTSRETLP